MRITSLLLALFVSMGSAFSGSTFAVGPSDLAISADPLVFQSASGVIHRQTMRIYATVRNHGDADLLGVVKFSVDGSQIATDQPVSVKRGSIPDEVFIMWQAVGGRHTVRAELIPYERVGDDPSNNVVEAELFVDYDTDGDGVGDSVDIDDDNDGWTDAEEATAGTDPRRADTDGDKTIDPKDTFPLDPREQADTDGDVIGDNADDDIDGDTVKNEAEAERGTDPRLVDTDGDDAPAGDGGTRTEAQIAAGSGMGDGSCDDARDDFPTDPTECRDTDGDGVGDVADVFPLDPYESRDTDGDGVGDNADLDADGDWYVDELPTGMTPAQAIIKATGPGSQGGLILAVLDGFKVNDDGTPDAFPLDAAAWHDVDSDGIDDSRDPDSDNDGYCDAAPARNDCRLNPDGSPDHFPRDPTEWHDMDRDGLGDNADPNDANQGPLASITGGDRTVIVHRSETFDAGGSTDVDGALTMWSWDFGDGTPPGVGPSVPHTYDRLGVYTVRLTVTDDAGESRVASVEVTVENPSYLTWLLWWLLLLLLLIFAYVVYRTVREKMKEQKKEQRIQNKRMTKR